MKQIEPVRTDLCVSIQAHIWLLGYFFIINLFFQKNRLPTFELSQDQLLSSKK